MQAEVLVCAAPMDDHNRMLLIEIKWNPPRPNALYGHAKRGRGFHASKP